VHGDAELAAVAVQLLAGADAGGVGGDQGDVTRGVLLGEARGQLGDGGGLAGAGRADQGDHAAFFQRVDRGDRQLARDQPQHQAAATMGFGLQRDLHGHVAGQPGVEAVLVHQVQRGGAHRAATQALVGEAVHLALDHLAHAGHFLAQLADLGVVLGNHGQRRCRGQHGAGLASTAASTAAGSLAAIPGCASTRQRSAAAAAARPGPRLS
jgi:hypothetical protein